MPKQFNPMVVRLPLFATVLTLLKRLLPRHRTKIMGPSRDLSLHTIGDPSYDPGQSAEDGTVLVITGDAVVVVSPAEGPAVELASLEVPREHCRLRIEDAEVRAKIRTMIDHDETLTPLAPEMVSDADIQDAHRTVAGWCKLDVKRETALFYVALSAIQIAERRLGIGF